MRAEFGERDRAGKQIERAALGVLDLRDGGERERGAVAAEIAGQFEVFEGDVAGGCGGRRDRSGRGAAEGDAGAARWKDNGSDGGSLVFINHFYFCQSSGVRTLRLLMES